MSSDILLAATSPPSPTWSLGSILSVVAVLVGITIVCFGVATFFQYYKWHTSPWYSDRYYASSHIWDWLNSFMIQPRIAELGGIQEVDIPLEAPRAPATESTSERNPGPVKESWCFVGADLTGRYCVKVPSDSACESDRLFSSRSDCELQRVNAMPAGVANQDGTISALN
jgi:hypothetical protein